MHHGTYVILDGLQDPRLGRGLSAAWTRAGLLNEVDVTGQCARLAIADTPGGEERSLNEAQVDRAAKIARRFALEPRDRVGSTFVRDNDIQALRRQLTYEYKSRLATALVFVLPALAVHYLAPLLVVGGDTARAYRFPWLIELLLVGWACLAGGWPILWQGVLAALHRRATPDLLTSLILMAGFIPSALGVLSLVTLKNPWFGDTGPSFHAVSFALILALYQRWTVHRHAAKLAGRLEWISPHAGRVILIWLLFSVVVALTTEWRTGLSLAMLLPPLFALGGVVPATPRLAAALPVFGFAVVFLMGPQILDVDFNSIRFEVAASFAFVLAVTYHWGWRRLPVASGG